MFPPRVRAMRACVSKDGVIDFDAWRSLGEDVTALDFVALERVAAYEADMRWEMTEFYREWSKQDSRGHGPFTTVAVQNTSPLAQPADERAKYLAVNPQAISREDLQKIVRRARLLAREAHREGVDPDTDPIEWLRAKGYA